MKIIEASDQQSIELLRNRKTNFNAIVENVRPIVQEVKEKGDSALKKFVKKYDNREIADFAVSNEKGYVDEKLKKALLQAKENICKFHASQMPKESWIEILPGIKAGQMVRPLEKVGCYVPGGKYPLVSTVLMTVLPAKVVGVEEVIVCTPNPSPEILYACQLCQVDKVYQVGGPMAIAAMAYGTETIPKVNKIVGPGNLYVSAAKKIVYGDVGIDFIAGPSEVVIIADAGANPVFIAADLLAQAEHDEASMALCITPSRELGQQVIENVNFLLEKLPTRGIAKSSLEARGAIIITKTLEEAFTISNFLAPEHLEIHSERTDLLPLVKNAGSIFLGEYAPEAAGDYASGPNHVLPTGGFASVQSGLSVRDFLKTPSVQYLTQEGLAQIAPTILTLAEAEGLYGHAASVKVRLPC